MTPSELEIFVILHMKTVNLKVTDNATKTLFEYTYPNSHGKIVLVHLDHYYIVAMLDKNLMGNPIP